MVHGRDRVAVLRPGRPARRHLDDGTPDGPDVGFPPRVLGARRLDDFRRHPERRALRVAARRVECTARDFSCSFRSPKISQLHDAVLAQQSVGRFHVSMGDAVRVQVLQSQQYLAITFYLANYELFHPLALMPLLLALQRNQVTLVVF